MSFKVIKEFRFEEGEYNVKIIEAAVINYNDGKQAIRIKVENSVKARHNFLIFTNNIFVMEKLIDICYEDVEDGEELDEQSFVGLEVRIGTERRNGYLNIVSIGEVVDFEDVLF